MNESLCDRCLACAEQVLETYEKKEHFNNPKELTSYILKIMGCLHPYSPDNPDLKIKDLYNFNFLDTVCSDCNIDNKKLSRKNIIFYIRLKLVIMIFQTLKNNFHLNEKFKKNYLFMRTLKIKLIQIQISKKNNYTKNYNKIILSKLIDSNFNMDDINFSELNQINEYFKFFFSRPIYLSFIDEEKYIERKKLKLDELIPKHPLVLNKENEECLMPYLQYYESKYFN